MVFVAPKFKIDDLNKKKDSKMAIPPLSFTGGAASGGLNEGADFGAVYFTKSKSNTWSMIILGVVLLGATVWINRK